MRVGELLPPSSLVILGRNVYETACMSFWEELDGFVWVEWGNGQKQRLGAYTKLWDDAIEGLLYEQEKEQWM